MENGYVMSRIGILKLFKNAPKRQNLTCLSDSSMSTWHKNASNLSLNRLSYPKYSYIRLPSGLYLASLVYMTNSIRIRKTEKSPTFPYVVELGNISRVQTHFILTCKLQIITECKLFFYFDTVSKSLMSYSYSFNVELVYSV
jgi:hypothetical protein